MLLKEKLKNIFKTVRTVSTQMVFPEGISCIVCNNELEGGEKYDICKECRLEFNTTFCVRCGRGIFDSGSFCDKCIEYGEYNFDYARSALSYNETATRLIHNFKYGGAKYLSTYLAKFLDTIEHIEVHQKADFITCVPLHKKRKKVRGYNQAELLANSLSNITGIKFVDTLDKMVYTKNLARLSKQERAEVIKNSFALKEKFDKNKLKDKRIILVDDVLTTTATADECAKILKKGGAGEVIVLTITSVASQKQAEKIDDKKFMIGPYSIQN